MGPLSAFHQDLVKVLEMPASMSPQALRARGGASIAVVIQLTGVENRRPQGELLYQHEKMVMLRGDFSTVLPDPRAQV